MGAMYKLKAYFGMVPVEELGEYDEPAASSASSRRHGYDDRSDGYHDRPAGPDDGWDRRAVREPGRSTAADRGRPEPTGTAGPGVGSSAVRGALGPDPEAGLRGSSLRGSAFQHAPIHGSVAYDPAAYDLAAYEPAASDPAPRATPGTNTAPREPSRHTERLLAPGTVPEQRDRTTGSATLAKITTLQPRSYNEARTIGERYRDGVPIIMNLTELDDAAAKRLVDFAAGLAFALRGSIDKVTSRVFLLTPADVEVSADDARRLAERGLFRQD